MYGLRNTHELQFAMMRINHHGVFLVRMLAGLLLGQEEIKKKLIFSTSFAILIA